jgi:hypothetical protein
LGDDDPGDAGALAAVARLTVPRSWSVSVDDV